MNILFIGDIVASPGRRAVREIVPRLRQEHQIDLVIANGENAAGGSGITEKTAQEIFGAGVDVITTGDHVWDQKETAGFIQKESRVLRPLNHPPGVPGHGSVILQAANNTLVAVISLQGRSFMANLENPFLAARQEIGHLRTQTPVIFVDFHAEATSEKIAMGRMLDGQISALVGTHTHVQTADEQIFPGGTAFLCDAGFTGPHHSVLGRDIEPVIRRFLTGLPQRFAIASDCIRLQGALVQVDPATGRAQHIQRVSETLAHS
ncbi:MAG TPA: TIGR00282 family metallophosphoesterase [Candidatus Paceibacterota bacterium]|nr:TIGR00282 family metallophosphoesterase [Verrucomicrobiota bacterium]HRY49044.1 TIGR00282 family metallophosphoesterase [Candidatus Paceibacterota bacterium]HSA01448.1 TIGR00282 family metallophosphoesterase [Candidatus Paceibacterota bacterium]